MPRRIVSLLLMLTVAAGGGACDETEGTQDTARRSVEDSAPEVFFAARDLSTEIVEVETATGKIRRTLVDFGPTDRPQPRDTNPSTSIETLDVASDGGTLYFGVFSQSERFSIYRLPLPDGEPERVGAGRGPSVNHDGTRLAFADESRLHVRDLRSGQEQTFENVFGDFGGITTSWAADSRWLAFEVEAADSLSTGMIDTATGTVVEPQPAEGPSPGGYTAYSPRYRRSDGLLAVLCCITPEQPTDEPEPPPLFALHDPVTGEEKERITLPFRANEADFDPSGAHLLLVGGNGRVSRHRGDQFLLVPNLTDVNLVAW